MSFPGFGIFIYFELLHLDRWCHKVYYFLFEAVGIDSEGSVRSKIFYWVKHVTLNLQCICVIFLLYDRASSGSVISAFSISMETSPKTWWGFGVFKISYLISCRLLNVIRRLSKPFFWWRKKNYFFEKPCQTNINIILLSILHIVFSEDTLVCILLWSIRPLRVLGDRYNNGIFKGF